MSENKPYESLMDDYVFSVPENPMSEVMLGLSFIGQALKDPSVLAMLIITRRNWGQAIAARACLYRTEGITVKTLEDDARAWKELEKMQKFLRLMMNQAIDASIADENRELRIQEAKLQRELHEQQERLRQELRKTNLPSTHGTVKEIAAKYNISLSEVRRMKADGTLDDFISKQ